MKKVLIGVVIGLALCALGFFLWKVYDNKENKVDYNKDIEFVYDKDFVTIGKVTVNFPKLINDTNVTNELNETMKKDIIQEISKIDDLINVKISTVTVKDIIIIDIETEAWETNRDSSILYETNYFKHYNYFYDIKNDKIIMAKDALKKIFNSDNELGQYGSLTFEDVNNANEVCVKLNDNGINEVYKTCTIQGSKAR